MLDDFTQIRVAVEHKISNTFSIIGVNPEGFAGVTLFVVVNDQHTLAMLF